MSKTYPPFSGILPSSGGGGGGAPVNASYLVLGVDGVLTSERVFTPVVGSLAANDGGAGGLYSLDLAPAGTAGTYAYPSSVTTDAYGRVSAITAGAAPFVPGASFLLAYFGVGFDGDVTIAAGTTTLSREMQYNNLTIAAGGILKPNGNRIFVRGTLTIAATGSINDDGNNAVGATIGANLSGIGYLRGAGGNPGAGRSTTGSGNGGLGIVQASLNNNGVLPAQGAGGTAGGVNTGGGIGGSVVMAPSQGWHTQAVWVGGRGFTSQYSGGGGGAGGGCDATGGTATSGGGGSAGGVVWVAAHTISNLGVISANGGAGGNAVVTLAASAGGGGGAPGGLVAVITASSIASAGTVTATGGAGGTGAGLLGAAGGGGSVGSTTILRLA